MRQTVPHSLAPGEARELIERALETYRRHYPEHSIESEWGDVETARVGFHVTGRRIDGTIRICADCYEVDVDLPWILRPFGGRIAGAIEEELRRWVAHAERRVS